MPSLDEWVDFDPTKFVDHYEAALVDLLKKKQAGVRPKETAAALPERRVINLMDALRRSIDGERPRKPAAQSTAAKRRPGRKRA